MKVKLAAALPKDDTGMNGLDELTTRLLSRPKDKQLVIGWVSRVQLVIDDKRGGAQQPTVEFDQIEAVLDRDDYDVAQRLIERAYQRRNGHNPDQAPIGELELGTSHLTRN